jgi:hypothetical protein
MKLVLQREGRTCGTWFSARPKLPNEALADAAIRELF